MKFIVDAQRPFTLSKYLVKMGFNAIHTDNLPNKELTTDNEIREISIHEERIVITKDSDFFRFFFCKRHSFKNIVSFNRKH
jgi:predicted nuclease of predicted toxin-antitoxin system